MHLLAHRNDVAKWMDGPAYSTLTSGDCTEVVEWDNLLAEIDKFEASFKQKPLDTA